MNSAPETRRERENRETSEHRAHRDSKESEHRAKSEKREATDDPTTQPPGRHTDTPHTAARRKHTQSSIRISPG